MTTFDTVTGLWVNAASVALPSGSDGDSLFFVAYTGANPGAFSGWSLEVTHVFTRRYRVYSKTRAGGETTVTLPTVSGSAGLTYSILNVEPGFVYIDSEVIDHGGSPTWAMSESYPRAIPRFSWGILNTLDNGTDPSPTTWSGDYIEDSRYVTAAQLRATISWVADLPATPVSAIDVAGSGGWDAGGFASWLAIFFSDVEAATSRLWWVGVAGWGVPPPGEG